MVSGNVLGRLVPVPACGILCRHQYAPVVPSSSTDSVSFHSTLAADRLYWSDAFILSEGLFIMTHDSQLPPVFRIDVSAEHASSAESEATASGDPMVNLMREMVALQEQQNQLLEDLNVQLATTQRQRANELGNWKEAHPDLARSCRLAAETLSRVQTQFLYNLTEDVENNEEALVDGEFMLNEFVDRYGPRLAHLNGVLQVLSQLSGDQSPSNSSV